MVWFEGVDKRYYGSTTSTLTKRLSEHKKNYKSKKAKCSLFAFFDDYGVDNAKIELVEAFPCASRNELEAREGFHIRNNEHINRNIAGRSVEEKKEIARARRDARIEEARAYSREYKLANPERIKEYNKRYQEEHREERTRRRRELRQIKKEKTENKK
jgi:hypothetical protein